MSDDADDKPILPRVRIMRLPKDAKRCDKDGNLLPPEEEHEKPAPPCRRLGVPPGTTFKSTGQRKPRKLSKLKPGYYKDSNGRLYFVGTPHNVRANEENM